VSEQESSSAALAGVVVDELVRGGVTETVLSPGSRSAPFALALHAADRAGRLRLHVRIDERSAGFLALGLAKASGRPVPVVCTSGTAVANLHPAVLEAHHAGVPLLALTADRPAELRGVGANQASEWQPQLFGGAPRFSLLLEAPAADTPGTDWPVAVWRASTARALTAAAGTLSGDPGPVHLDFGLPEPLLTPPRPWSEVGTAPARPDGAPWLRARSGPSRSAPVVLPWEPATVVVAGDAAGPAARRVARRTGWPLLAEPSSGARVHPEALPAAAVLADRLAAKVRRVVVYGHPTLFGQVTALLGRQDVELIVAGGPRWPDPAHRASLVVPASAEITVPEGSSQRPESVAWRERWRAAAAAAAEAAGRLVDQDPPTGPGVARAVAGALPPHAMMVMGSSALIRDLDWAAPWAAPRAVVANRGLAGIDGTVSTAWGAALAHQAAHPGTPSYALMGDLTFLHDANGLLVGPAEPRPDLTLVVVNDDGGGIFHTLEQGTPAYADAFERVFATPHGADLAALCQATGTEHVRVDSLAQLRAALLPRPGVRVVEVPVRRSERRGLTTRLVTAAGSAAERAFAAWS
jgi:2-succinyl-5-enolpyruvyl-6-hydroxy-3-cyclohexene-1-carboxylate synthase